MRMHQQPAAARGFVLSELLLAIAAFTLLVSVSIGVYSNLRSNARAEEQVAQTHALVTGIQRLWGPLNSYATVTPAAVAQANLVRVPLRWTGTQLLDAWGNSMGAAGMTSYFAISIGGSTAALSADECAAVASRLANDAAYQVQIGTAATVSSGLVPVSGGNLYKVGTVYVQGALSAGCSEPNPVIAASFR